MFAIVAAGIPLAVFGYLSREMNSLRREMSDLDSRRKSVAKIRLSAVGPLIEKAYVFWSRLENFHKSVETSGTSQKVFEEDPSAEFKSESIKLRRKLETWSNWNECLETARFRLKWCRTINRIGMLLSPFVGGLLFFELVSFYVPLIMILVLIVIIIFVAVHKCEGVQNKILNAHGRLTERGVRS